MQLKKNKQKKNRHPMILTNSNKKTFLELFMVFTSLTLIFFYLYLRITRKQRVIELIPEEIQKYYSIFFYFFAISCFILSLLALTMILKKIKVENKMGVFEKIALKLKELIDTINIFYKSYTIIFQYLSPKYTQHLVTYASNIMAYTKIKTLSILFVCVILPRLLIISIFIFELYQKTLHYYFFSLLLLLIPLGFRFLLFIYNDINKQVLPKLEELLELGQTFGNVTLETPEGKKTFGTIGICFRPEYQYNDAGELQDINHFITTFYNPMLFIGPHMKTNILPLYHKINSIVIWVYALIQATGWAYVLFYLV